MHAVLGPIFGLYHLLRDEFSLQLILKPPPPGVRVYKAPKKYSNVNIHMCNCSEVECEPICFNKEIVKSPSIH